MLKVTRLVSGLAGRSVNYLTWGFNISLLDVASLEKLSLTEVRGRASECVRLPEWCSGLDGWSVNHLTWGSISLLDVASLQKLRPVGCLYGCQSFMPFRLLGYKPIKWLAPVNRRCCFHRLKKPFACQFH